MPKLSPGQPFGPIPATVILDASGNGTVAFQATGSAARVTNLFCKVSTVVNQATVSVYLGTIADTNRVFNNNSGSTGFTAQGQIDVPDGTILYVVWTGGDVGASAIATFSGRAIPFDQIAGGFEMRADDPIAAGDGSLIFPALKSPNFVTTVSGWRISRNGDAEFNNAIIRGTLDIAGGVVIIQNNGITIDGMNDRFIMNTGTGFKASPVPDDGSYITHDDAGIFWHLPDPSAINGLTSDSGSIFVSTPTSGSIEFPRLSIASPLWTGKNRAYIRVTGEGSTGTDTFFEVEANKIRVEAEVSGKGIIEDYNGVELYGKGFKTNVVTASSTAAIGTTETVIFTTPSVKWEANRAYRILMNNRYSGVSNPIPLVRCRKTNLAGQSLVDNGRVVVDGGTYHVPWTAVFTVGGSDVTAALVMSLQANAGTITQVGAAGGPRMVEFFDIGPSSRYPNFTDLV
jgi:hypothetical protein